jgi:hypothetical protein
MFRSSPKFLITFFDGKVKHKTYNINVGKNGWAIFWATFSQTHLVTLHKIGIREFETGLPDGLFKYQNPYLDIFWRALEWKMLVYFLTISNVFMV